MFYGRLFADRTFCQHETHRKKKHQQCDNLMTCFVHKCCVYVWSVCVWSLLLLLLIMCGWPVRVYCMCFWKFLFFSLFTLFLVDFCCYCCCDQPVPAGEQNLKWVYLCFVFSLFFCFGVTVSTAMRRHQYLFIYCAHLTLCLCLLFDEGLVGNDKKRKYMKNRTRSRALANVARADAKRKGLPFIARLWRNDTLKRHSIM